MPMLKPEITSLLPVYVSGIYLYIGISFMFGVDHSSYTYISILIRSISMMMAIYIYQHIKHSCRHMPAVSISLLHIPSSNYKREDKTKCARVCGITEIGTAHYIYTIYKHYTIRIMFLLSLLPLSDRLVYMCF